MCLVLIPLSIIDLFGGAIGGGAEFIWASVNVLELTQRSQVVMEM